MRLAFQAILEAMIPTLSGAKGSAMPQISSVGGFTADKMRQTGFANKQTGSWARSSMSPKNLNRTPIGPIGNPVSKTKQTAGKQLFQGFKNPSNATGDAKTGVSGRVGHWASKLAKQSPVPGGGGIQRGPQRGFGGGGKMFKGA